MPTRVVSHSVPSRTHLMQMLEVKETLFRMQSLHLQLFMDQRCRHFCFDTQRASEYEQVCAGCVCVCVCVCVLDVAAV